MKKSFFYLKHFLISTTLILSSLLPPVVFADPIDDQKAECAKHPGSVWNDKLNRCTSTVEAKATRNEADACTAIVDVKARAECHKKIAEKKTGLSADPNSLPEGTVGKSMIMNGIGTAYALLGLINGIGSKKKESTCTSKKIFGVTAFAGTVTDIWLKIQTKKKLNALKDKYQIDVSKGAYDAQLKAFEYLKEEQQTVKDIASKEKKRNMLLTLGYGAAAVMAIYEMTPMGAATGCYGKDAQANEGEAQNKPPAEGCPEGSMMGGAGKCVDDGSYARDADQNDGSYDEAERRRLSNHPPPEPSTTVTATAEPAVQAAKPPAAPPVVQQTPSLPAPPTPAAAVPTQPNYRFDGGIYDTVRGKGAQGLEGAPSALKGGK